MSGRDATGRWRDWAMLALAVWLFVSPWLLGFVGVAPAAGAVAGAAPAAGAAVSAGFTRAAWNAWALGIVVAAVAIWAIAMFAEWQDWLNGILGLWLVVAPWVLGFSGMAAAVWDHVIVGRPDRRAGGLGSLGRPSGGLPSPRLKPVQSRGNSAGLAVGAGRRVRPRPRRSSRRSDPSRRL